MENAAAPGLEIRVLGPLDARIDGRPIAADTRKAVAILALLAVDQRPFARDELAAMFWPDADDEAARGSLRRTLSTLRSGLGDRWVRVDRSQVELDRGGAWIDLEAMDHAIATDDAQALAAAAALVRGPFLAGFNLRDSPAFDDWRAARASAVERGVAGLLDRLATIQADAGDLPAAVATATRRLEVDPLDEPAQRRVIGLLAEAGDRAAAIRQYRACAALLDRELGVAPLAETVALYEAIREGTYAPPARAPGSGESAGGRVTPSAAAGHPPPVALAQPGAVEQRLPFVGRDEELGAIRASHRAVGGAGRVVAIEGEPGIGKTRLLAEIGRELASGGAVVLQTRAWAAETGIAFAPIVDVLRQAFERPELLDRLGALPDGIRVELGRLVALPASLQPAAPPGPWTAVLDPSLARARLLDALASSLTALLSGPVPGMLAIDDLHVADASTLELVGWLLRRLGARPFLLVLAWRPEDLGEHALPVAALAESQADGIVLRLGRLDRAAIAQLVAGLPGPLAPTGDDETIGALAEASEGLPLDLSERLLGGARPDATGGRQVGSVAGPRGFRALLRERLGGVGETASQVLAAGAVIGRSFDLPTVRAASGRAEEETVTALEELIGRGLIRESPAGHDLRFDFVHGSLRDAAYEGVTLVRRRLLHRRVAEALRAGLDRTIGVGELAQLVLIAQHERDAGQTAEAADAFRVAAERARRVYAHREAVDLVESAIALGHPDVAELHRALGELRLELGEYAAAVTAFEAAAGAFDGLELAEVELRLGRAHARRGDLRTAASHLDAALAALTSPDPDALRLREELLVERGLVALQAGDPIAAERAAAAALEVAVRLGDGTAEGRAHRLRGLVARDRGDLPAAREALRLSLELASVDPDPGAAVAAANALALVENAAGNHEAAIGHLQAAASGARRIGAPHLEAAIENNLADSYHAAGDTERSMEHLRRAVALFAEIGGRPDELEPAVWKLQSW